MAEVATAPGSLPSLAKALEAVPDHRKPRGFRAEQPPVLLIPSLLLLIVGVLIGRRGYGSLQEWGRLCEREQPEVVDALGFPGDRQPRIPAAATLFRLVRDLNLAEFQQVLPDQSTGAQGADGAYNERVRAFGEVTERIDRPSAQLSADFVRVNVDHRLE
jgi:hypothetical protein